MTKTRIVTIICWSVSAVFLAGLAVFFLTGTPLGIGGFSLELLTGPYEPVGTYAVPAENLDSLHVDWVSSDISVKPYDGSVITLTEYAQRELRDGEKLYYAASGGTLIVKFYESNTFRRIPSKKLEVLLPRELCENFAKLTMETTSGGISASGFNAETAVAESTSGKISLSDFSAVNLRCETTSGKIVVSSGETVTLALSTTSGEIDVSDSLAQTLDCETTSGDINLSGFFGSTDLDTTSGDITVANNADGAAVKTDTTSGSQDISGAFDSINASSVSGDVSVISASLPGELKTETTSGSVSVTVPADSEVTVHHSSTSGKFSSEIPVIMQSRDAQFSFSATSGDVKIFALD